MTKKYNLAVEFIPQSETVFFWGKSCKDILSEEFKDCSDKMSEGVFWVSISENCPQINIQTVNSLIDNNYGYKSIVSACGNLKIINNAENASGEKTVERFSSAAVNSEKIEINEILRKRIVAYHIENGVYITKPEDTYIDFDVEIESGVTVYHNNFLTGKTVIKKGSVLMPNNNINDTVISENVTASASTFNSAYVGEGTTVGPNAYLRPKANVGKGCKIGDFVEVKNAVIGNGTKISHLAYVGDAVVGEHCNIGCGVIFVNYNGKTKNISEIGNNCFIGSNCNVIAPVKIEDNVFVAAGTSVTKDLPSEAFCIGRVRAEIKEQRAMQYLKKD